jgi:malate dehydrogenase (oxaloacetate-decarboxylating)
MDVGKKRVCVSYLFADCMFDVKETVYRIAECNNASIYPDIGFGAIHSQLRSVTGSSTKALKRLATLSESPAIQAASSLIKNLGTIWI